MLRLLAQLLTKGSAEGTALPRKGGLGIDEGTIIDKESRALAPIALSVDVSKKAAVGIDSDVDADASDEAECAYMANLFDALVEARR